MILPALSITDSPHLAFRAVHLCWFPETRPQQIERAIRLAALLKFNYAILEPWGTYKSEKHAWRCWPNAPMTKEETSRLVALGRDLGKCLGERPEVVAEAAIQAGGAKLFVGATKAVENSPPNLLLQVFTAGR